MGFLGHKDRPACGLVKAKAQTLGITIITSSHYKQLMGLHPKGKQLFTAHSIKVLRVEDKSKYYKNMINKFIHGRVKINSNKL